MTHDPYYVEDRKPLTSKQRMELFVAHAGTCCICGGKIHVNEPWIDEHRSPLWRAGTNDLPNRGPAHVICAKVKTAGEAKERAKGRRIAEKHFGARVPKGRPMAGSKRSKFKKHIDGSVTLRDDNGSS